jgi:uroporphyrinogen III methyltransferase/synthase
MPQHATTPGQVFLVGAGPGDPGLITQRGIECLGQADLVLYDYLVNPRILEHARHGAELICLGRHGRDRVVPQAEVNAQMVRAAQAGQVVVRLKSGDPMIFGRAAQEIAALVEAGVYFEVVPGVTTAVAVSAYTGIPLTERSTASAVALVTAREADEKANPLDLKALASFPGTLVLYMGVTTAPAWSQALIAGGRSADTPAAIIRRCTWPDQLTIRCTLGEVATIIAQRRMRPPVIVIVGEVAARDSTIDWFSTRPLFGRRILVTRAAEQIGSLRSALERLGAEVLAQPALRISPPANWQPVDAAIDRLDQFDWLVFSSTNGVRYFFDRLLTIGRDVRAVGRARLAVIGPGTGDTLASYGLQADLRPTAYRAEVLADALCPDARGQRYLLLRASRGREVLFERLRQAGGQVEQVVVYQSTDVESPDPEIDAALRQGQIDYVTVTSSAIARSLSKLFGEALKRTKLVSISPLTSSTLRELGLAPALEATDYTMEGIVAAIRRDAR